MTALVTERCDPDKHIETYTEFSIKSWKWWCDNNDAILIQLPLPKHINEREMLSRVKINKDVDGFHTENIGNLTLENSDRDPIKKIKETDLKSYAK